MKSLVYIFTLLVLTSFVAAGLGDPAEFGYNNADGPILIPIVNASLIPTVNSSDYWDDLDTPADINTGDLTDDDTYVKVSGDSMTGNLEIDDAGDETSITLHGGDTNLNASLIFQEVTLDRWQLLFNGLNNNFYLWNDFLDSPTWMANLNTNAMTFYGDLLPGTTLSYDIGSGALRWRNLYVQNINAEEIDTFNLHASENITVDGYINGINISNLSNEYVPYTGATNDVDLGANNLTVKDKIVFGLGEIIDNLVDGWLKITGSLKIIGDLNVSGYIEGKNYVTQYHRNATIDTTSADTWVNITWDLTIDDETTSGYSLTDSNVSITIEHTGIYRVQGCLHPKNNGVGNQEASLYSRILINGIEAKCLQFANSKEFKTTGIDTMPFTGTVYAEAGQKVQLQYYVTSTNIDFEGDAVFDDGVAGSLNLERISNPSS